MKRPHASDDVRERALAAIDEGHPGHRLNPAWALDRSTFDTLVADLLVPGLRPGEIVVLDNLSVHRSATARQRIEAVGAQLWFLPVSSPDIDPIE